MNKTEKRFSFIALIGETNVGKSTIVNQLVGSKVSIVSEKPQTTRIRILGIFNYENSQIALIDVPGIFTPRKQIDKLMYRTAWDSIQQADSVCFIIDSSRKNFNKSFEILEKINSDDVFLILNKIDLIQKNKLLEIANQFNEKKNFKQTFMISALTGDGIDDLRASFAKMAIPGEWMFPENQQTDLSERIFAAEITREKAFINLQQEVPYSCFVDTENWEEFNNGDVKINQIIYVQKENHRPIILGKNGNLIKKIRTESQEELSQLLNKKVHLFLHVKVMENWTNQFAKWFDFK